MTEKYGFCGSKTTCFMVRDDDDIKIINIMALILYISAVYKDNDIKRKNDNEILMWTIVIITN